MVTVIGCDVLEHVLLVLCTVKVALYTPVAAPPGIVIEMGDAGNAVFEISAKPSASAAASKLILY